MEQLKDTNVLKFHTDTLKYVRKQLEIDQPGMMEQSLDILEEWIKKQEHFMKKDFPRSYLERHIINCKGSVERAKERLDKMCSLRTSLPHFFETFDAEADYELYKDGIVQGLLPTMTSTNERVFMMKNKGFKTDSFFRFIALFVKVSEYLKVHEYSLGFHIILDFTELNILDFVRKLNPIDIQNSVAVIVDGMAMRLKSIQVITESKVVDVLVTLLKQCMSTKLGNRICVHRSLDELHNFFSKDILPNEYGGQAKTLKELNDILMKDLTSEEFVSHLKSLSKATTNEKLRRSNSSDAADMPGTFRQLTLD